MPQGTFQGAGVKTVVLFFEKGEPSRSIWYYRLDPGRSMGKTNPLNDADMAEFVAKQASFTDGPKSWSVPVENLDPMTLDLSVRNPNAPEAEALRSPADILDEIARLDGESAKVLARVRELL
jgi:type I restriction enzyme M protein